MRIDNLEVIDSSIGRRELRFVLAWAELHRSELEENWQRAARVRNNDPIDPLR